MDLVQLCSVCQAQQAAYVCLCPPRPSLCSDCLSNHVDRNLTDFHDPIPLEVLRSCSLAEYQSKRQTAAIGKGALQHCIDQMKGYVREVENSIDLVIKQLRDFKASLIQTIESEVLQAETDLAVALQEVECYLRGGTQPQHPLATEILTRTSEELHFFTCTLTPPDVEFLMLKWVNYVNNLPVLCRRMSPRQVDELTFAKIGGMWWPGVVLGRRQGKKQVHLINQQTEALWILTHDLLDYTSDSANQEEELVKALELARYASAGRISTHQLLSQATVRRGQIVEHKQ